MSSPKVSVVLITYNHEKYIKSAIESIIHQSFSDFELIIVDDGSTDKTSEIIHEFKDPRIIVIEQINSGPSIALNTGIIKSNGQFIAIMSGDDLSMHNRLEMQLNQIESEKADIIFCLPQIIGPNSNILDKNTYPIFFEHEFSNVFELYSTLFYFGNFLCASSFFGRRTAINKIGFFKKGLMQLQDFDYVIRACKLNLEIQLFNEPLIQYRYLFGKNLSDSRNNNRIFFELKIVYRDYFNGASLELLRNSFSDKISLDNLEDLTDIEIDKIFLYLNHSNPLIKEIGAELLIEHIEDNRFYEKLTIERNFQLSNFFNFTNNISTFSYATDTNFLKKLINLFKLLFNRFILNNKLFYLNLSEEQLKEKIIYYLESGDYKRAILLTNIYKSFVPAPKFFTIIFNKFRNLIKKTIKIIIEFNQRQSIMEDVFILKRMIDYCEDQGQIIFKLPQEEINLKKPIVIGNVDCTIEEGTAFLPQPYISVINNATITGGSTIVLTKDHHILNDEMIDFPTEDFGIKSPYIYFRYKDKIILTYTKRPNTHINYGILLMSDHDNNYFHWLLETLPKLLFIDSLGKYDNIPLLVTSGLDKNLYSALEKVNVIKHPIIFIDPGVAYYVDQLIYPSALSRMIDRYKGHAAFNKDIIFSPYWILRIANLLKPNNLSKAKPWRKLYLARNNGLRKLINQDEIIQILSEEGFEIIDPENLTFDSQIDLFSLASVIVAPTGASLANMLWCQPGTKIIVFMSNHETTNFYFWSYLGDILNLEIKIIIGERSFNLTNYISVHDDYTIDPLILRDELKKI